MRTLYQSMAGLIAVAVVSVSSPAAAETEFEVGGRFGFGIPFGKVSDDGDDNELNKAIAVQFPLMLDIGARIGGRTFVGGYLGFGLGVPGEDIRDTCDDLDDINGVEVSCAAFDLRLGVQAHYHFQDRGNTDPWIGGGLGYEWGGWGFSAESDDSDIDVTASAGGMEFLNLQGGIDFPLSELATIGPFLMFTIGRFDRTKVECSGDCEDVIEFDDDIEEKALHNWLMVGGRITFFP